METIDVEIMDTSDETNNSRLKSRVLITKQKIINNIYEPKVALEDKVYPKMYYSHQLGNVVMDETPTKIKVLKL